MEESLWMGRPCICSAAGAIGERTLAGGCLTADVTDPDSLSAAIATLLTDRGALTRYLRQAAGRTFSRWEEWVNVVLITDLSEDRILD